MKFRPFLLLTILCLSPLAFSTPANAQVDLQFRPPEDSSYVEESVNRVDQKLTIAGMEQATLAETTEKMRYEVGKRDASGNVQVKQTLEEFQVSIGGMGNDYKFDSKNPDNKGTSPLEALRDMHKALSNRTVILVYDQENRVTQARPEQDILGALPVALQDLVRGQLDPEKLKDSANEQLDQLPGKPVNPGDTWERTESVDLGAGQRMTFQNTYTYEGPVTKDGKQLDKITSKATSIEFAIDKNSPLPLTLTASKLSPEKSQTTILVDRERGQKVESTSSIHIKGELTFNINGMDIPSNLDLKMESRTKLQP